MKDLLQIHNLYGGYKEGVNILHEISLTVQQGESVGIIGLNGSGKSTFGKSIMGMIPYRYGVIEFNGEDVTGLSTTELAHRGISIMQQGGKVFRNLSVWENLQLASNSQLSTHASQLEEFIPLLHQPKKKLQQMMADKLSGGQKHQLSLAMTLASNPKLVILDEPSAGLSPIAVEEMYQMLRAARERLGLTIILIEQNIAKAVEFCGRSLLIQQGKMSQDFLSKNIQEIEKIMFNNKCQL